MSENALTQYLDLWRDHSSLITSGSPEAMNALRPAAAEALAGKRLPAKGSENYETTDLQAVLDPDYGLNLQRLNLDINPAEAFRCALPALSTIIFSVSNDVPSGRVAIVGQTPDLQEGVTVCSLRQAAVSHPEILNEYYGKLADLGNPVTALDTLLAQDGLLIHVARGVKAERPIQIVNLLEHTMPLMAVRRVLVVVEEEAEVSILSCDHTLSADLSLLALQTTEIFAHRGARVDWYDLEESTRTTQRLCSMYISQKEASDVLVDGITLTNGLTRNEYFVHLTEPHASLRLMGMAIQEGSAHTDNMLDVRHLAPNCHSDELFKYTLDDEATGAFTGRIYVKEHASGTQAYQSNRNIVGSDKARMYSKPQLEIYNDDVKCSHGTAIGTLDEKQLFYMEARGIPEREAKRLLKQAFMTDVVEAVRLAPLRDRLNALVERRFSSNSIDCNTCSLK